MSEIIRSGILTFNSFWDVHNTWAIHRIVVIENVIVHIAVMSAVKHNHIYVLLSFEYDFLAPFTYSSVLPSLSEDL